jgi:HK97 family phage major capsid protein
MNLREQYAALLEQLKALREKAKAGTLSAEESASFDAKVTEARSLKEQLDALERRTQDADFLEAEHRRMTSPAGGSVAGIVTPQMQQDARQGPNRETQSSARRSPSEAFLADEGWQRFRDGGFSRGQNSGRVEVGTLFRGLRGGEHLAGMSPQELLTLVTVGGLPTDFVNPARVPGVYTPDMPERNVRSAFLNLQTSSPLIQFFRELLFTNAAAFVAEATATAGSSGLKPESALTFEADSATVQTLAHWIPVTNQTLEDEPTMRGIIEGRLIDGLQLVEDDALLNGSGTPPEIDGLLNVSGIQVLDAAYWGADPVEGAGEAWEDFDRITRARREVRITGRARPSFVLMSPADLERLITITDNDGQYFAGSPFSDIGVTRMRGLQVIETEALDEGDAVVGDGRMAAVFDRMAAAVTAGWIDQQFVRNMITLLAEERLAFAVFRPAAFAHVTLTSA